MKKPSFVSHYLVLQDLVNGVDVRQKSDIIYYLTSRIENIKCDLKNTEGLEFVEDITKESTYSTYKPYVLVPSRANIDKAEKVLLKYATDDVLNFLETKQRA